MICLGWRAQVKVKPWLLVAGWHCTYSLKMSDGLEFYGLNAYYYRLGWGSVGQKPLCYPLELSL